MLTLFYKLCENKKEVMNISSPCLVCVQFCVSQGLLGYVKKMKLNDSLLGMHSLLPIFTSTR